MFSLRVHEKSDDNLSAEHSAVRDNSSTLKGAETPDFEAIPPGSPPTPWEYAEQLSAELLGSFEQLRLWSALSDGG
jgi:hypothetical protein